MTPADLIHFESCIRRHWQAGRIPSLLHLCGGNEEHLCRYFADHVREGDWVLSTHRNHYHALLAGIQADELEQAILDGYSMFTFSRERRFLSSSVLAGTCGIAAGLALACRLNESGMRVHCFLGDGAEEQGHFYEAALYVEANGLPCKFIIEDNDRQVDTPKDARRGRSCSARYPLDHFQCVRRYHYVPTYPHAGDGSAPGTITFQSDAVAQQKNAWRNQS